MTSDPAITSNPSVSVVIACRDAADTLGLQLEALARQQYDGPWDLIISDNGSTDLTRTVVEAYRHRFSRMQIVDSSRTPGAGPARNFGVTYSTAEYILFCDADDEVAPNWMTAMASALRESGFAAGRFEGSKLNSDRVLRSRTVPQQTGLQHSPFGPSLPHAGAGNLGIRRETFTAVGGFDPSVGVLEDTDLCWRVHLAGTPLVFAPSAIVHVRFRGSLPGIWRQGWNYGQASAVLEERYGPKVDSHGHGGSPSPLRKGLKLLAENPAPESLSWVIAWHLGHRAR